MENYMNNRLLAGCLAILVTVSAFGQSPTPLAANGRLQVLNKQLCSESGRAIQLRGMSSHGLQWFDQCYNQASVQALASQWGADVFRAAMYVDEGGYLSNPTGLTAKMNQIVDWSAQAGMYCIIDWHILNPGNPNDRLEPAKTFFRQMAQTHAGKKHVIYELCNEPNGVTWDQIKTYADQIIPIIRQYDPQALILVGTPNWCQRPQDVLANPLSAANAYNVLYTVHFYAGSHYFQQDIKNISAQLPLFVSEWGTSNYSGNGGADYTNAQAWIDLMAGQNPAGQKISWCNWSFADKDESSAALNPGACSSQNWNNTSTSGTWVKNHILRPADDFGPMAVVPSIAITAPTGNTTVTVGSNVVISASVSNTIPTMVEFYTGTTKLGDDATAPYTFTISNIAAGAYPITAKAILPNGGLLTSSAVQVVAAVALTPLPTGEDFTGSACVLANDVKVYELSAANLVNATSFSWWCTGSTQSMAQAGSKTTISFGSNFTGGQVCVGVNYSTAPWYKQFCRTITVCSGTPPPPPPAPNVAPTVTLTAPANNATFIAPATVLITANATDSDGSIAKVEFFNGNTKLGEAITTPYPFSWASVAAGTYSISAKVTDNQGQTATSGNVNITVSNPTPPPPPPSTTVISPVSTTAPVVGPDCARPNHLKLFEVNAANLTNATAFSWWCTGSTRTLTPTAGQPSKLTIDFGPWFNGGDVCVSVNYSVAPWHKQYCKTVSVCAPGSRVGVLEDETDGPLVSPNPTNRAFTFVADHPVRALRVIDDVGRERLQMGSAATGQVITFGESLSTGSYLLQIQYQSWKLRTIRLLKMGQ